MAVDAEKGSSMVMEWGEKNYSVRKLKEVGLCALL